METYTLHNDIRVFCITAASFPDDILEAWQKLHALLPSSEGRKFFGISYKAPGAKVAIIYKAAVEESYPGEAEKYGCEIFVVRKGMYLYETLPDWKQDPALIGKAFQSILADKRIDEKGYCLEVYERENEVKCMVTMDETKSFS
jgi:hypothetical protein